MFCMAHDIYLLFVYLSGRGFCLFLWCLGQLSEFHFLPLLRGFPPFQGHALIQFPKRGHPGEGGESPALLMPQCHVGRRAQSQ